MVREPLIRVLALCVHLESTPALQQEICRAAEDVSSWEALPELAEFHGMAPLVREHLRKAGVVLPQEVEQALTALTLRHRLINTIRTQVLVDIFARCQKAGVNIAALKGAALAHQLYPRPELRPMKDMDLLVDPGQLEEVQQILKELGFANNMQEGGMLHRHLMPFQKKMESFSITIEVHHSLCDDMTGKTWFEMDDLARPLVEFTLGSGTQGKTLGYEDMLYHLCWHAVMDNGGFDQLRFIQVADILNFARCFELAMDWDFIKHKYPAVLNILSALQYLNPLPESLAQRAVLYIGKEPAGIGVNRVGWPELPLSAFSQIGIGKALRGTFFPSAWWLYLHYGKNRQNPVWYHWLKHAAALWNRIGWHAARRIKRTRKQDHGK